MTSEQGPARCSAFGLDITSSLPLPGTWRATGEGLVPLSVERASPREVQLAWSGTQRPGWRGQADGHELIVDHGRAGDLRLWRAPSIDLHLSSDGTRLLVSFDDRDWLAMMRLLLDSALFSISLMHGYEALHAGAVDTEAGVLVVAGASGSGKSSTIAALLRAGCEFRTDDVLVLRRDGPAIVATPGPPLLTAPNPVPAGLGDPIADLGADSWLSVTGADADRSLAGMVCLDPAFGPAAVGAIEWPWLIGQLLRFPRTREREHARFDLASDLVTNVPALRMPARGAPPDALARRALEWLRSLGGA
jgi:hypothetical protein